MNWKLIFQLSLFGLAMAIATVFWIPSNLEPFFWIVIFIICAYLIARNCTGKFFLHGFLVCLVNCVWITAFHFILFRTYIMNHPDQDAMMQKWQVPWSIHPRRMMLVFGPMAGIVSGLILGLFSFIASKIWKSKPVGSK
jgi:hypothetical protein